LLTLGACYERVGKSASAWAIYKEAASAARAAGQQERTRFAEERVLKLAPELTRLALLVSAEAKVAGLEVLLDNQPIAPALFGVPFHVDPGSHLLTARAPGKTPWTTLLEVKPRGGQLTLEIPKLSVASGAVASGAVASGGPAAALSGGGLPSAAPPYDTPVGAEAPADGNQKIVGLLVGAGGILALGTGIGFGAAAASKDDEAKRDCPSACLTEEAAELNSDARSLALVANISYALGVAAVATGAVLYLTAGPTAGSASAGLRLDPALGLGQAGVSLKGGF
jgi:serine/threonine-protein kinase